MGVQTKTCIEGCGWCCQYQNLPIPINDFFTLRGMLELYRTRGDKVYIDPVEKSWYVLIEDPCVHWDTETTLCRIHKFRPELCRTWTCHNPGHMHTYYAKLIREGRKYEG
jgi:Fe-S-cluster containining protein